MSKKFGKRGKAKLLENVCLHCAFFQMHQDKWPDWQRDGENVDPVAFNDLMHSASKIVSEVFSMIDAADQVKFMRHVMEVQHRIESTEDAQSVAEVLEAFKQSLNFSIKH